MPNKGLSRGVLPLPVQILRRAKGSSILPRCVAGAQDSDTLGRILWKRGCGVCLLGSYGCSQCLLIFPPMCGYKMPAHRLEDRAATL